MFYWAFYFTAQFIVLSYELDIIEVRLVYPCQYVLRDYFVRVRVEDQGEYECHAKNDRTHISDKITLSIQSKPVFTIPIGDQFVDENDEVIWTCEAFGIPDVEYMWLR